MNTKYTNVLITVFFYLLVSISCNGGQKKDVNQQYNLKTKNELLLYGVNIDKILESKFINIEKEFNIKTHIDKEVSVIFIDKYGDFIRKEHKTKIKDHISITYGPIENLKTNESYLNEKPKAIAFYGRLKVEEPIKTKVAIIKELRNIIAFNEKAEKIIDEIKKNMIEGQYNEDLIYTIKFNNPKYPLAVLYIGFAHDRLFYKYVFSKVDNPYPTP